MSAYNSQSVILNFSDGMSNGNKVGITDERVDGLSVGESLRETDCVAEGDTTSNSDASTDGCNEIT